MNETSVHVGTWHIVIFLCCALLLVSGFQNFHALHRLVSFTFSQFLSLSSRLLCSSSVSSLCLCACVIIVELIHAASRWYKTRRAQQVLCLGVGDYLRGTDNPAREDECRSTW